MRSSELIANLVVFGTGALIGYVAGWYITKKKFEPIDYIEQEEIPVVSSDQEGPSINKSVSYAEHQNGDKPATQYNKLVKPYNESGLKDEREHDIHEKETTQEVNEYMCAERPYLINLSEFGELEDYVTQTLYYFEDHVLTEDTTGAPVDDEDISELIGWDNLKAFDEDPEWDACYIRNDTTKTDYEILRDIGCYYPVTNGGK